jgi:serine/threonine protein kinase
MGTTRTCSSCGDKFAETLNRCPRDGAALFSDEVLARVGMRLKDHEILSVLGEGGMGAVYRARHVVIEKPVAIKILNDGFARQKDMVEQFIVEAKAASRIRHPNIIDVTDFGTTPEGLVFLIMEYLDGESLESRLNRTGRVTAFEAINIVKQVARGLGAAHQLGIVHRDLKPANIFLCRREGRRRIVRRTDGATGSQFTIETEDAYDFVKLLDFGVAKFLDRGPGTVTRAGMLCGSPYYLSPEQAQEKPATERSDIYALGATLYEMVTGTVPFDGTSVLEVLNGHVWGTLVPPSQRAPDAEIDARLDAVILKCLEKDPERRFASADEIRDALRECVTDRAFLRDAHRLPGIRESGFDLSEATASARREVAAAQVHDQGFSEVEGERESVDLSDDEPRSSGRRERPHGDTMRIPRQRSSQVILWSLFAALIVIAAGALWAIRAADHAGTTAVAAAPPVPPPSRPAAPPAVAPKPAAPPAPALVAVSGTPAGSKAPAGLGAAPIPASAPPSRVPSPAATRDEPSGVGADKPSQPSPTPMHAGAAGRVRPPVVSLPPLPVAPEPEAPPPTPAAPPPTSAPPPIPPADVQALLHEAQTAWTKRYYAVAIDKAREVLKAEPKRQAAHQIIAVCSCAIGRADDAREAAAHLDEHKRKMVQALCQRDGVTLE